jgi:hypothetical protein
MQEEVGDEDFAIRQRLSEQIAAMPHRACGPVFRLAGQIDGVKLLRRANRVLEHFAAQCSIARAQLADVFAGFSLSFQRSQQPAVIAHDPVHLQKVQTALNGMRIVVSESFEDFWGDDAGEIHTIDLFRAGRYTAVMANVLQLAEIPDDLAAEAAQVPGFGVRLVSFIRAEVSQHRKRKVQNSSRAKALVEQARAELENSPALSPEEKAAAKREFAAMYEKMMTR